MARIEDLETTRPPQEPKEPKVTTTDYNLQIEIEIMRAAGLDDNKIARLALLKTKS